ncbi:MAG: response regulator, partial [Nitrospirae bacterium]
EKTVFDLIPFMKEFVKFISRTLPENIKIDFETTVKRCNIKADPTKIQQVLANLIVNARDAMPEGGQILLSTREKYIVDEKPYSEMSTGRWVEIMVKDTGTGIPRDVLPHIFEPFFTTKGVGKGTGLGLSQAYGIVKQHEGFIEVKSKEGEGTTFYIYLPIVDAEAVPLTTREPAIPQGKGQKVLVIEDDESVRVLTINLLNELNYHAEAASTAREALALFEHKRDEFDIVICDLVMPDLNGIDLSKRIKELKPSIPVIGVSGYPLIDEDKKTILKHFDNFLQKPFSIKALAEALRDCIKD